MCLEIRHDAAISYESVVVANMQVMTYWVFHDLLITSLYNFMKHSINIWYMYFLAATSQSKLGRQNRCLQPGLDTTLQSVHFQLLPCNINTLTHWTISVCQHFRCAHYIHFLHYCDAIMRPTASQITGLAIVYSIVYSGTDQRKHQSSASLAFVREFTGDRWIPRTSGQQRGKCFQSDVNFHCW